MSVQEKWKANADKVAFMKRFPGLLSTWEQLRGKTIDAVEAIPAKAGAAVLVASDGSFVVAPPLDPQPADLREALNAGRRALERHHADAYTEFDQLALRDREATRSARLENILGAIQNNLEQIPELKDRIRELVKQWK